MRKEKLITRTIYLTDFQIMVANTTDRTVSTTCCTIPSADSMNEKQLNKAIADQLPENTVLVMIENQTVREQLYGMTEQDFMKYAKVMSPRSTKEE